MLCGVFMKKLLSIFTIFLILLLLPLFVTAHSGRTDSHGGHNDNIHGGYHYHHGYSAHQHTDDECPYIYEKYGEVVSIGIWGYLEIFFFSLLLAVFTSPLWFFIGWAVIDKLCAKFFKNSDFASSCFSFPITAIIAIVTCFIFLLWRHGVL